ncbi:glycosyltransferase family 2 protein [Dyadobacter sp. CY261]|uniref:glycosyltransferase family 2 protein n=1 Tax=Dyadobacter sp. CY261 TaxID=2907203 RepID=UPI001F470F2A|nr:glycosyltransferase family 2 protein [Dyadobacter sp. CY261]MCF0072258.1 glycosyltransferase family 2 protein [Dyadobacter sp. CY261]
MSEEKISVIIPVYNQALFIGRAIRSVQKQTFDNWEIIVVNDGSSDQIEDVINLFRLEDDRISYFKNERNEGLGFSLNKGIGHARYDTIAYLPADDVYFEDHLYSLREALHDNPDAILAYSGIKYNYRDTGHYSQGRTSLAMVPERSLQLVQVMHRKVDLRWVERAQLTTADLGKMYWDKLNPLGNFVATSKITAEWVSHPLQRHQFFNEFVGGGIYRYKEYYHVKHRIRFESQSGSYVDEFRDYPMLEDNVVNLDGEPLKILLVGELAYNAQRICALERMGHKLYGLWIDKPFFYNTIGPLPFGNVEDIPKSNWKERVKEIKPDVIYGLLNFSAVPLAHEVLVQNPGIPFVWHFKESPFYCRQQGTWNQLVELYQKSDGQIYINEETRLWFEQFLMFAKEPLAHILDGDLPPGYYFKDQRSELLSESVGGVHTVVPGRPFGIQPEDIQRLAAQDIHLHFYGDYHHRSYKNWLDKAYALAPDHLHIYHNCTPDEWTAEFSKYDAGWLHVFESSNFGELMKAEWLDLNYPARMSTLAAAGLPMIQRDNSKHTVASQSITGKLGIGVFFESFEDLGERLRNQAQMRRTRENCWDSKSHFSFEHHVHGLVDFFKRVIRRKYASGSPELLLNAATDANRQSVLIDLTAA